MTPIKFVSMNALRDKLGELAPIAQRAATASQTPELKTVDPEARVEIYVAAESLLTLLKNSTKTPRFEIHLITSDKHSILWGFDTEALRDERCRMLAGLTRIRLGNTAIGDNTVPYTKHELTEIFGEIT